MHFGQFSVSLSVKEFLTFNPQDARAIQRSLKASSAQLTAKADESNSGPAYVQRVDPDGNAILIDHHEPNYRPGPSQLRENTHKGWPGLISVCTRSPTGSTSVCSLNACKTSPESNRSR